MTNRTLVNAIGHLAASSKALDQLLRMSRDDIDRVLRLLTDQRAINDLRQLLKTVRRIQQGTSAPRVSLTAGARQQSEDDLEATLTRLFGDQKRFPTVTSIMKFAADVFKVRIPKGKDSRRRYVFKVVRAIKSNPKALYHARNKIAHGEMDQKDQAYVLLYNFIRGRLTE